MMFKINKEFTVIIIKNKLIDFVEKDTKFDFKANEQIKEKTLKYLVLDKMINHNLVPIVEYQIFSRAVLLNKEKNNMKKGIVEFDSVDQLLEGGFIEIVE